MSKYKIILYTEELIADKIYNYSNETNFVIAYKAKSYEQCINQLIQLKENVVIIFQMFHPIYKVQDFYSDLAEVNLSPFLISFSQTTENELVYSMTSHNDQILFKQLQNFFTNALSDFYQCHFNYISDSKDSNIIMNLRIKQLEREEYLKDILRGVTEDEFDYYKKKVDLKLKESGYYLYIWNLADIEYTDHVINKNIYYITGEILLQECQEIINSYNGGEVFYMNPTMLCIIVNHLPSKSQVIHLQTLKERVNKLNKVMSCKTSFRYESNYIKDVKEIRNAYEDYHNLKIYNFFCSEVDLLTYEFIDSVKKEIHFKDVEKTLQKIKEIILHDISSTILIPLIKSLFLEMVKPSLSYDLYYYCHTFVKETIKEKYGSEYKHLLSTIYSPQKIFFSSIEQQCNDIIESIYLLKGELSNSYIVHSPIVLETINYI